MAASPEMRFRVDRAEQEQFERVAQAVGMDAIEMVRVFIRRSIAVGGFPFEMRAVNDALPAPERVAPVHGVSVAYLSNLGARAAQAAHAEHVQASRLPASAARGKPIER